MYHSNRLILVQHNVLGATNVTQEIYNQALNNVLNTSEARNWTINPNCSLKQQLSEAAEGTGLAFIVFTQAIVKLPGAPFWAVLFFTMLLSLGLGSQIGLLEGMLCTLFDIDIFKRLRKQYVTGMQIGTIIIYFEYKFFWRLPMVFLFDSSYGLSVLFYHWSNILYRCRWILVENVRLVCWYNWLSCNCTHGNDRRDLHIRTQKVCISIHFFFRWGRCINIYCKCFNFLFVFRFTEDIYQMTGYRPGVYWQWTWRYIGPAIMSVILISSIVCLAVDTPTYNAYTGGEVKLNLKILDIIANILYPFKSYNLMQKCFWSFTDSHDKDRIPWLGYGYWPYNDCSRYTTNTNRLLASTLPNTQSWPGHSPRLDSKEWNNRIN